MDLLFGANENVQSFLKTTLLWKTVEGVFLYTIVILSYFLLIYRKRLTDKENNEARLNKLILHKYLERVAVKDRQEIHIIQVPEIVYIEACGDYVSLFTASGSYLKEKTMKYFEEHLPSQQFVRIHRSYIVNVNEVAKVELYEKESYRIHLKNGKMLKASSSGYKVLKEVVKM